MVVGHFDEDSASGPKQRDNIAETTDRIDEVFEDVTEDDQVETA